jgi:hypothetical protein
MCRSGIIRLGVVLVAALVVGSGSAQAASFTLSTSLTDWTALQGGAAVTTEDFSDTTLATGLGIHLGTYWPGTIAGGVWSDDARINGFPASEEPSISFTPGTTAWGADWDLALGGRGFGLVLNFTFADGTTGTQQINQPATGTFAGFLGFTSAVAFTSVDIHQLGISGNGEAFTVDNLVFVSGPAGPGGGDDEPPDEHVPEPGTLGLLATGLCTAIGRGLARRKQK